MQEAMRVFPGLAPGDQLDAERQAHTPLSLADAAAGIKAIYQDMLDRAWRDAASARREAARRAAEGDPAGGAGPAMRRLALASPSSPLSALSLPALALAHDQPETASRAG